MGRFCYNARMKRRHYSVGFTIVELLIVIVVIGILAALVISTLTSVQRRAYDTAVQNDLTNFHKVLARHKILNGSYPASLSSQMGIKFTRSAHGRDEQSRSGRYCVNTATDEYIIYARSLSGKYYRYMSSGGPQETYPAYGWSVCNEVGLASTNPQENAVNVDTWAGWVN